MAVTSDALIQNMLEEASTELLAWTTPRWLLWSNDITPGRTTLYGDVVPATFDGYAPISGVPWTAPYLDVDQRWKIAPTPEPFWLDAGSTTPETEFGLAVVHAQTPPALPLLLAAVRFPVPYSMIDANHGAAPFYPIIYGRTGSGEMVLTDYAINNLLQGPSGGDGLLVGATLHLYQNDLNPGRTTLLTDFVEATFGGYADIALPTWEAPFIDVDGTWKITPAASAFFQASSNATPNTIFGWWIESAESVPRWLAAARFPAPYNIVAAFDAVNFDPTIAYGD